MKKTLTSLEEAVALLAEGVDRNSSSARLTPSTVPVALLAEGVDRNDCEESEDLTQTASPSSRRAWIEISKSSSTASRASVALLAEGVDRNSK